MTDLAIVLISGAEMEANLVESLAQPADKPSGFSEWKRQMSAIQPGLTLAFIEMVDSRGRQVTRFMSGTEGTVARRVLLTTVTRDVQHTSSPYFDGYPYDFRFQPIRDVPMDPPLSHDELAQWLGSEVEGLELGAVDVQTLVGHAKSNKVGLYIDGAPRLAEYFGGAAPPVVRTPTVPVAPAGPSPTPSPASAGAGPLAEAIDAFAAAIDDSGLIFRGANLDLPRAFLAALAAKPFAILSGLSGSGKTQIARALGQWLGTDPAGRPRYRVEPVRPDWTSPEPLLGYRDALLPPAPDGRRAWTVPPALQFMRRAALDPSGLYLLVLDEMNLAHVERYFADVLSGIESTEQVLPDLEQLGGLWYQKDDERLLAVPDNLMIVGTVNVDETTYQFSPKVLDRAFTFDFRVETDELATTARRPDPVVATDPAHLDAVLSVIRNRSFQDDHPAVSRPEIVKGVIDLHERLSPIGFEFGHRTNYEAARFAATLSAAGIRETDSALDWIIMTKLLPRIHGSRRQLEEFFSGLLTTAEGSEIASSAMPLTARKMHRMLDVLRSNQFASFAE